MPCLAAVTPFGIERPANRRPAIAALRRPSVISLSTTDDSRDRIIVEFTVPPLARTAVSSRSIAQYQPLFERFREDLERIVAPGMSKGGGTHETAFVIRQEYFRAFSGVALSVAASERAAIAKLPYVRRVYPDLPVTATAVEPGVAKIRANEVWTNLGSRGVGVTVAIIDTGVDYNHPALGGGFGPAFKVVGGHDFVNKDIDPMDDVGHGTHVAGIVAANAPDLSGVAPEASLLAYKVLDYNGTGWTGDVLAGIERTVDPNGDGDLSDHADVANMSLGAEGYSDDAMSRAVDTAVSAGVVFAVAAGNRETFQSIGSPGTAELAITVGATDFNDALASFTSKGPPAARYGIKPDVVAPGVDVRSAKPGGGTLVASGTSMAAPHVAGAAALLLSLHPDWTPQDVKSALVTTAAPMSAEVMAAGAGRIDTLRAATITTRLTPAQLGFGIIDGKAATWSGTRPITVTNRGATPRTYELATSGARDGIGLDVTPTALTLAPGESAEVAFRVTVDNAKVPYPPAWTHESLSYSGFVEVRSGNEALRVPWAFVKAARLRVRYNDDAAEIVNIFMGGAHANRRVLPSIGWNLFEMAVTAGTYSLLLVSPATVFPEPRETTMILRDDQWIDGEREFDLSPADAPYRLTFNAVDEMGQSLRPGRSEIKCLPFRFLLLPSVWGRHGEDLLYSTGTLRSYSAYPPDIRTSTISDRYSLFGGEVCADSLYGKFSKFYVLEYAPIHGASANVSREAGGAKLHARKARLLLPPTSDGQRIVDLSSQFVYGATSGGFTPKFSMDWPLPEWNGTVFLARNADPNLALQPIFFAQTDQSWFVTHPLRVVDSGVASFPYASFSPTTYVASPTDPLEFGLGPITPKLAFNGVAYSSPHEAGAEVQAAFSGPLDEWTGLFAPIQIRLFDDDGRLLQEGIEPLSIENLTQPLRLEIEAHPIHNPGTDNARALIHARFGGSQPDRLPPSLTSLVLFNAQSQPADQLRRGSAARLRFSAMDFAGHSDGAITHHSVKPEATKVWARATGSAEWHPLQVVVRADDLGNSENAKGTIFECTLAEITKNEGWFDLRISVEDASFNSTETTLESAFIVTANPSRRRGVRP